MLLPIVLTALAGAAPAPPTCPELEPALAHAEASAASPEAAGAEEAMLEVERALACAPPAAPALVARVLRAQGAVWFRQGAVDESDLAFASAARLDPAGWTEPFGPELQARFQAAGARSDRLGSGRIALDPAPPAAFSTWLNGEAKELPAFVPSGLHLVQVVAAYDAPVAPGLARSARLALVFDQDDLVVDPGPMPLDPAWAGGDQPPARPGPSRTRVALLTTGAGLVLASGATALLAHAQAGRAEAASADFLESPPSEASFARQQQATLDEIDAAEQAQRAWAGTTWALLGAGLGSVGVAFVF